MDNEVETLVRILFGIAGLSHILLNKRWVDFSLRWMGTFNMRSLNNPQVYRFLYIALGILLIVVALYGI